MAKTADRLLSIAFALHSMRGYLDELREEMFIRDPARDLYGFLRKYPEFDGTGKEVSGLKQIKDYVKIITLQFEELYEGVDLLELQYEAARLRTRLVELFVKDQKKQIIRQMETSAEAEQTHFLEKVRDLDQLLKRTKE